MNIFLINPSHSCWKIFPFALLQKLPQCILRELISTKLRVWFTNTRLIMQLLIYWPDCRTYSECGTCVCVCSWTALLCSWAAQTAWRVLVSASYWSKLVCRAWNKSVWLPPCSSAFLCTMQIIERRGLAKADKNCKYLVHLSCFVFLRQQLFTDAISYYIKSLFSLICIFHTAFINTIDYLDMTLYDTIHANHYIISYHNPH